MAHHTYNFACIIVMLLVCVVNYGYCKGPSTKKEKCDVDICLSIVNSTSPINFCTEEESNAQKCISKLNEDCAADPRTIYLAEKVKLIHNALCGKARTEEEFGKHPECWPKAQECLNHLVTPENMLKGKVCDIKKVNNDKCKVREDVSIECKTMHAVFLEHAFQESQCCGVSFTVSVLLVTLSLMSAIYSRIL